IVDLVRTSVVEVFTLQKYACPASEFCKPWNLGEDRRSARVVTQQVGEFSVKLVVVFRFFPRDSQIVERVHERFGDELPSKLSEVWTLGFTQSAACRHNSLNFL